LQNISSQLAGSQKMDGGLNVDLPTLAMMQAKTIALLPAPQQELALQNLELQSPELADLARQMLLSMGAPGGKKQNGASNGVDARPNPTQKPPRRPTPGI
jgi:hypothetical protein